MKKLEEFVNSVEEPITEEGLRDYKAHDEGEETHFLADDDTTFALRLPLRPQRAGFREGDIDYVRCAVCASVKGIINLLLQTNTIKKDG